MKADERCRHCGRDFADHNYVKDSINQYACPEQQYESGYGGFYGGDPRNFHPAFDDSTDEEKENHRLACAAWDDAESKGITPTPEPNESGWLVMAGTNVHIFKTRFGLGVYQYPIDSFFEAVDPNREKCPWEEDDL